MDGWLQAVRLLTFIHQSTNTGGCLDCCPIGATMQTEGLFLPKKPDLMLEIKSG